VKSTSFQLRLLAALLSSLQLLSAGFVFLVGPVCLRRRATEASGDGFVSPLNLVPLPDGRLLIADQVGTVHVMNADGKLADTLFFDARSRLTKLNQGFDERGLLGLMLHPKFKANGKLYMYYSAPRRSNLSTNWDHTSTLSEFKVKADMSQIDSASETRAPADR
jgi:glucose/arabinose dehydrogenase